jgi:hypothetical protein
MLDAVVQEGLASVSRELHQNPDLLFNLNSSAVEVRIFVPGTLLMMHGLFQFVHFKLAVGCHIHYKP